MRRKIALLGGGVLGLILLAVSAFLSLPDGKLHLVFCNVGQGDAIYIRTPKGADVLIDGGPDSKVLNCLSSHMPFWDRDIELAILTHPQADHLNGFLAVLPRYKVDRFGMGPEGNESEGYKRLIGLLKDKKVEVFNPYSGEKISFSDGVSLDIVWPYYEWVEGKVAKGDLVSFDRDGVVLGAKTGEDLNSFSEVVNIKYGQFSALLMGDADSSIQGEIMKVASLSPVDVLKVPHHGSKTSLREDFLNLIKPNLAVISVGKNSYGHPTKELLEELRGVVGKTLRTDLDGEVEVVSDNAGWTVK